jgi:HD-GYP domain-containing protein (c-di-GMP phosphodiesterase class II)
MKESTSISIEWFNNYCNSFKDLTENQKLNFRIKKEHSVRVAEIAFLLSDKLEWNEDDSKSLLLLDYYMILEDLVS